MLLESYRPRPRLVTSVTEVLRPAFTVVEAHTHLSPAFGSPWEDRPVAALLDVLDESGVALVVDLDGGWGEATLHRHLRLFKEAAPERFKIFGGVDWARWSELGDRFPDWAAGRLRAQKSDGAEGLKVWKSFGLSVRDGEGRLARIDDARLSPIWGTAAELGLPVTIHVADPVAFFDPVDELNERYEELRAHPDWSFPSPPYPPFLGILEDLRTLVRRERKTTFIGAHVGCYAEDLVWVGAMLEECPNYYVDISARVAELGRQPRAARAFMVRHADRIIFGTDSSPDLAMYRLHYRFLETADEHFAYGLSEVPEQGRWRVSALDLPASILALVYGENAFRLFGRG